MIAAVARRITWSRLWDSALDLGDKSVKGLQYLSRAMSHHGCGNHPCPLCDTAPLPATVLDHHLDCHSSSLFLNPTLSSDGLIDLLQQLHLSVLCNFSKLLVVYIRVFVLTLGCIDELLIRARSIPVSPTHVHHQNNNAWSGCRVPGDYGEDGV